MKTKMTITTLIMLLSIIMFSSCTTRLFNFTIISTKNINLEKMPSYKQTSRIIGVDKVHWILFIPTGVPNIEEAIDNAIESIPGCVGLLDGVVYSKFWYIPYIYGQQSYLVEGTPLVDPELASNIDNIPEYSKLVFDRKGKIETINNISPEAYLALKDKMIMKQSNMLKLNRPGK